MPQSICAAPFDTKVLRLTKVDFCGRPVYSPASQLIIECVGNVEISPDVEVEAFEAPDSANNKNCYAGAPGRATDNGREVTLTVNKNYPDLGVFLNRNNRLVSLATGDVIGFEDAGQPETSYGVTIELWEETVAPDVCTNPDAAGAWKFNGFFHVSQWVPGDAEFGAGAHPRVWVGRTVGPNLWGVGPYNVVNNPTPSPLPAAVLNTTPHIEFVTTLTPPVEPADCTPLPLSNPAGPTIVQNSCTSQTLNIQATSGRPMQVIWGDGTAPAVLVTATPTPHVYALPGRYVVTVRFTDAGLEESYLVVNLPCS